MLYADDTMLLLGDTKDSLHRTMSVIREFGSYSGLVIHWTESSVMLFDTVVEDCVTALHDIPISSSIKYLGVYVTPRPLDYLSLNLSLLLGRICDKAKV